MEIMLNKEASTLSVSITGSIDTVTAPELDSILQKNREGITQLILDFRAVDYISSAGLRVVMMIHEAMEEQNGSLILKNVNADVMEVFEMTGFDTILAFA